MPEMTEREQVLRDLIADLREECAEKGDKIEQQAKEIEALRADAMRYRFLRDNGHLNKWWSVAGPSDRCENIDTDIDATMTGQ